ncbi:MAG: Rhs family protein, partial [Cyanobacteria bacterium J06649_11]
QAMLNGTFEYGAKRGIIAGWLNNGRYIISEGHHRVAAAMEILKETGNARPILQLLENGAWSTAKYSQRTRPLPARSGWTSFRNWLGF